MTAHPRYLAVLSSHFFLFGPRGTGKSTWLRQHLPGALWIDLLDPSEERLLQARPEALRERVDGMKKPGSVVIGEVQRAPGVLTVVHALIEEKRRGLRFVLTGSSAQAATNWCRSAGRARVAQVHAPLHGL